MSALEAGIIAHRDLAAVLADWAQALALGAGAFGVFRYTREKRLARQASARQLYADFLHASVASPELYGGAWSDGSLRSSAARQKYVHYVALFLWAGEEILREHPGDAVWRRTLLVTIGEHRDYFASDQFDVESAGYSDELVALVREGAPA